jgi:hypothetical protein
MMSPDAFDGRLYFIIPSTRVGDVDFEEVLESESTLRYNSDSSKTFVCYESSSVPVSLQSISDKEGPYTNDQILSILNGADWAVETSSLEPDTDLYI